MQITFAIPRTIDGVDYEPDTSADLDDDVAGQLIRDGYARAGDDTKAGRRRSSRSKAPEVDPADVPPAKNAATDLWVDYASRKGVAVPDGMKRAEIIRTLDKAGVPIGPPAEGPEDPEDDPGADTGDGSNQEKE